MKRLLIPESSTQLYLSPETFTAQFGPNFFHVTGTFSGLIQNANKYLNRGRPLTPVIGRCSDSVAMGDWFSLSNKIAIDPQPYSGEITAKQAKARATFLKQRKAGKFGDRFPLVDEIREGKTDDALSLLAGGVILMTNHDFGNGPETRIGLYERKTPASPKAQWVLARSLVTGQGNPARSILEESTPVSLINDRLAIVHALYMNGAHQCVSPEEAVRKKMASQPLIKRELAERGFHGELQFFPAKVNYVEPRDWSLPYGEVSVLGKKNGLRQRIAVIPGCIVFEAETRILTQREVVEWPPSEPKAQLALIDGAGLGRKGNFLTQQQIRSHINSRDSTSPSFDAILGVMLSRWSRDGTHEPRQPISPYAPPQTTQTDTSAYSFSALNDAMGWGRLKDTDATRPTATNANTPTLAKPAAG